MRTTEEILFDELKYRHKHLQLDWAEAVTKSYRFLQINAVILSIIVIGLSIGDLNTVSLFLFLSSTCIIVSMGIIVTTIRSKPVNVVCINELDTAKKNKEILRELSDAYKETIEGQTQLHNTRMKAIDIAIYFFASGAFFLSVFIICAIIITWL